MTINSQQSLYKLQTWFSPSFPVGAYTYSHGLEYAFETGLVTNVDQAVDWIGEIISSGNGYSDVVFALLAHEAITNNDHEQLYKTAEFAAAFSGTKELRLESEAQGAAFIEIIQKVEPNSGIDLLTDIWPGPYVYPIAIGVAAGAIGIDRHAMATAILHGFVSNLASALVRIVPLGQTDGQRIIAQLSNVVETAVSNALSTGLDELSTSTLMVDLTSMHHETQYTRLFRS
jgi:urease accessory protein